MLASVIREVLTQTPGVQSVADVVVHSVEGSGPLVTARLGFGPSTPASDIVAILGAVRAGIRAAAPEVGDVVLEPEVCAPRSDANPPTDVFVIRGAD